MTIKIHAVLVGKVRPLGQTGAVSAIDKRSVHAPVAVTSVGIEGDEQGNTRIHGGPEKAVHHYALDHYATWHSELPETAISHNKPGALGENISTTGLTETNICIGDIWKMGTAHVEVSQARQPCWKLNHRFNVPNMSQRVQNAKRTGWYYRIKETGIVAPGDTMHLVERPHPTWTLERMLHYLYEDYLHYPALEEMIAIPQLSEGWKKTLRNRVAHQSVEDWKPRLLGH